MFTTNCNIRNQNINVKSSVINLGDNGEILKSSVLNINNGSMVNTVDGKFTDYIMDELHSSEDTKYNIDIVLNKDEQKADTFTLTNGGSGVIYISSINVGSNIINDADDNEKYRLQIIKSASENAPQLDYDDSKVLNQATANMTSDIIFAKEFGLCTTDTKNDTLEIRGLNDTFAEWAAFVTDEDKSFKFVDEKSYVISRDVVDFKGQNSTVIGMGNTFDLNNKLFLEEVREDQNISISDINFINSNGTTVNNGKLTLDNVTADKDFINNNEMDLKHNIALGNLTNNGDLAHEGENLVVKDFTNTGNAEITAETVTDNLSNEGTLAFTGNLYSKDIVNSENAGFDITGNVVADEVTNSGELNVTGSLGSKENVTTTNKLTVSEDLTVVGNLTNSGEADISGTVTAGKDITNDGTANIGGNLNTNACQYKFFDRKTGRNCR